MKHLLIFLLIAGMLLSAGCFVIPEKPEPEVTIICEGGNYSIHYSIWSFTGCDDDPWYVAGVYWHNANGRMFLIGDTVWPESVLNVYGLCPTEFIEEILFEEVE